MAQYMIGINVGTPEDRQKIRELDLFDETSPDNVNIDEVPIGEWIAWKEEKLHTFWLFDRQKILDAGLALAIKKIEP